MGLKGQSIPAENQPHPPNTQVMHSGRARAGTPLSLAVKSGLAISLRCDVWVYGRMLPYLGMFSAKDSGPHINLFSSGVS